MVEKSSGVHWLAFKTSLPAMTLSSDGKIAIADLWLSMVVTERRRCFLSENSWFLLSLSVVDSWRGGGSRGQK